MLLVGPPGTGKTLLARAVAGEAGVPFFSISGSEFIQMFVGVGASRVRDMFKTAKENAPCLLFIDEIDAVGRMRGAGVGGGSDEREQTLNQILSEMDGFTPTETVIVIAATNRPDVLDSALLRPGRFDRHVTIDRPTWQGRLEILKVHTRNKPLADNVNLEEIARKMIGMTGADLRNLANEAAILATRENKTTHRTRRLREGRRPRADGAQARGGPERGRRRSRSPITKRAIRCVGWFQPELDPPKKVTIVPRGRAGGVDLLRPDEDRMHYGLDYFKAELAMMMGGRAADRLVYGQLFAGAEMRPEAGDAPGPLHGDPLGHERPARPDVASASARSTSSWARRSRSRATSARRPWPSSTRKCRSCCAKPISGPWTCSPKHRADLDRLVEALLQKEELYEEEIAEILGAPPQANRHRLRPAAANGTHRRDLSCGRVAERHIKGSL